SLTAAVLPNTTLTPFHLEAGQLPIADEKAESWRKLVRVGADREPQFLLFADPFSFDTEPLLLGLDRAYPHSPKIGGLASGATSFGHHALFLDQLVYRSGLVGLALAGDIVLDTVVAQGCRPIGEPLFVTRAETNRIFTLDGKPPLIVLRELHEQASEEERKLFRHSLFLGIAMRDRRDIYQQGDFLIRNIAGIDAERNALVVSTALAPNSVVQFHLRDARTSAADLETLLGRFDALPATARPRGSLLFSCVGRGERLYGEANHDSRIFARHLGATPLGGFFCNGEIGPVHGMTFLHGYTSAFGLFRPRRVT
ncbi:MAG: FIST C-terminal domain-containing protein, partial [Gammaproteobacteria bacterium]